jgi:hypothetical protein
MFAQGKAGTENKSSFSCMINTNIIIQAKIWQGTGAGDEAAGEEERREKDATRRARSRGHVRLPKAVAIREMPLNRPT